MSFWLVYPTSITRTWMLGCVIVTLNSCLHGELVKVGKYGIWWLQQSNLILFSNSYIIWINGLLQPSISWRLCLTLVLSISY